MTAGLEREVLEHLEALVGFDTQNPPRDITLDSGPLAYAREVLEGADFEVQLEDHGQGCCALLAVRGTPRLLINCHLDTVPANASWTRDPFELHVEGGRAVGLGACDIKGAAAGLLAAAGSSVGAAALLLTTDEEAGSSRCVRAFLAEPEQLERWEVVLVSEPTGGAAVLEHRGIVTYTGRFHGVAGHASLARALEDSALHELVRWSHAALEAAAEHVGASIYRGLSGIRLNLGVLEGGTKPNMIADQARVRWGIRPLPSQAPRQLARQLCELAPHPWRVEWEEGFVGPTLPAARQGQLGAARVPAVEALARGMGLELGAPVDFWTEAALFSEAGLDAIVFGPGDIAQAHTADEWVELGQLFGAARTYVRLMGGELDETQGSGEEE